MHPLKVAGAVAAAVGLVLGIVVQFTSWGTLETEGGSVFGVTFPGAKVEAKTWEVESSSGGSSEDASWYEDDADDGEGVTQIRIAIPFLVAGLVVGLGGTLALLLARGAAGPIVTLVAGLLAAVGTILFAVGVDAFFEEASFDWGLAFYFAIAAAAGLVAAGILGLLAGNAAGRSSGAGY